VADDDEPPRDDRRRFLKFATCALGGGVGLAVGVPAVSYLLDPVGRRTVVAADEPIDAIAVDALGIAPVRVPLHARSVRDAWTATNDVALGAAWIRKDERGAPQAFSAACPHLGCAVSFVAAANEYHCPCHNSAFTIAGERREGPSKRGLDPLPLEIKDGRVYITFVRYRAGGATREPA
jgi:menaquinol-cytochrome c reductase iron-sulfur subunit